VGEQGADNPLIHVHGLAAAHHLGFHAAHHEEGRGAVEKKAEDDGEDRHQQIGDRRCEVALQLFLANNPNVLQWEPPGSGVAAATWGALFDSEAVNCRKMVSRLRPTARSSFKFQPALTTVRARSGRIERPCRLSISKTWRPSRLSLYMTRLTPATCSRRARISAAGKGASTSSATASEPRRRLVRLATVSVATSLPWLMMMTLSQECSISDKMCVLKMMVWSPARLRISWRVSM